MLRFLQVGRADKDKQIEFIFKKKYPSTLPVFIG